MRARSPRTRRALVVLLVAAAGLAVVPAADAAWPGLNGRVSLTQRVPAGPGNVPRANRDIFAYPLDADAALRTKITLSTDNEEQSSWSPDGRWLAYKRRDAVWVIRWDGAFDHALTEIVSDDGNNTQPAWSPDGKRIVFRSNRDSAPANVADVWVMDAPVDGVGGGTNQHALVRSAGDERYPSFSPDGTKLVFRSDQDGAEASGDEEIFVADADGTNVTQLTHNAYVDSAPAWSPDGSRIAFEAGPDGVNREIFVMQADGSHVVRLTTNTVHDEGPAWSPDGRMLAFTRADTPTSPGNVWIMNADGTGARQLSDTDVIEESPDWQPLPALDGVAGRRVACGDLSLASGGVASVVAVNVWCGRALSVAARWQAGARTPGFECSATPHSFDQTVVECAKRSAWHRRRHCREKRTAFVVRAPADTAAQRLVAPGPAPVEPADPEPLDPDDALPRGEES